MLDFYRDKKVLITGHTGFKGAWLTEMLSMAGARVTTVSSRPPTPDNLYTILKLQDHVTEYRADIRDLETVKSVMASAEPEFVFHLAAQAIVRTSYDRPIDTFAINTLGTAHILEAIRCTESVKTAVIVTTDKVYDNKEWIFPYRENDQLGGHDPYSSSKAAADIITQSYIKSFFTGLKGIGIARAGNVIGGGDWAANRLIPDIAEAILRKNEPIILRSPNAIRPWQHVLEPLHGYLLLAEKLSSNNSLSGPWNFAPSEENTKTVEEIVKMSTEILNRGSYVVAPDADHKHEANILSLDSTKSKRLLGWKPKLTIKEALELTLLWYDAQFNGQVDMPAFTRKQIQNFYSNSDDAPQSDKGSEAATRSE